MSINLNEITMAKLEVISKLLKDHESVRKAFASNPLSFIREIAGLEISSTEKSLHGGGGVIDPSPVIDPQEIEDIINHRIGKGGNPVAIAVCAVVV